VLVRGVTDDTVSLSWNIVPTALQDPVISYIIQYRTKSLADSREFNRDVTGGFREIRDVTGVEYDVSGLEAFTLYELRLVSVNSVGRSAPSHSVEATTSQRGIVAILFFFNIRNYIFITAQCAQCYRSVSVYLSVTYRSYVDLLCRSPNLEQVIDTHGSQANSAFHPRRGM